VLQLKDMRKNKKGLDQSDQSWRFNNNNLINKRLTITDIAVQKFSICRNVIPLKQRINKQNHLTVINNVATILSLSRNVIPLKQRNYK